VIIFRYLAKELYSSLLAITLILLMLFITNQFVHYLKIAANGEITMMAVMQVMSLQIPLLLGYLLPLGLYLGILITYGRWCVDHELTVMFSCGVSRGQLMVMTMTVAIVVMIIVAILMLWVEPIIQSYRSLILDQAITRASIEKVVPKRFQNLPKQSVFYLDRISRNNNTMYQVFFAKKTSQNLNWDVTLSQSAKEQALKGLKGQFIVFQNGHRYIGVPGQKDFQTITFQHYGLRLAASNAHINDWPNGVSTYDLWRLIDIEKNQAKRRMLQARLQWRLAMPISVVLFALLAFPLGEITPRSGKFSRFFPAILIYIVYADLIFLGRAWIEQGAISPLLGLWWIHGAALILAIILNGFRIGWRRVLSLDWLKSRPYAHS